VGIAVTFEIHTGFVSALENRAGRYTGSPSFSLNDPSVTYYSPGPTPAFPLNQGDYVAVAVKRTIVPGAQFVAFAYRGLGVGASAKALNAGWQILCIIAGATFIGFEIAAPLTDVAPVVPFLSFGSLVVFGIFRLISMRLACRALDAIESPLTARFGEL